jgi:hypothetical protein
MRDFRTLKVWDKLQIAVDIVNDYIESFARKAEKT